MIDIAKESANKCFSLSETIAYREDVFNYIQGLMNKQRISNTGIAYKITEDARRGVYEKENIPNEVMCALTSMDADEWFVNVIKKQDISFLNPTE